MNEVFRRRLIGLAVLLVAAFLLSLLLPRDETPSGSPDVPSTTVSLVDAGSAPPTPEAAPPPATDAAAGPASTPASTPAPAAAPTPTPTSTPTPTVEISDLSESGTAAPAPSKPEPKVAPPPRPVPAPVAPTKPAAKPTLEKERTPAAAPGKPADSPKPAPAAPKPAEAAPKPPSNVSLVWYVQVGSFADRGKADTILSLVEKLGYKGEVSRTTSASGATLNRVRLGPFASEAAAREAQARIARQGYPQARAVPEGKATR